MSSDINYKISLEELAVKGKKILEQRSETTYAKALAQVQKLKMNSKVAAASKRGKQKFC